MRKFIKKFVVATLSLCILGSTSFCLMSSMLDKNAYASSIYEQESGISIDKEYTQQSEFMPSTNSSIGFSGKHFRNVDSMTAGQLFSSTIDGAKVTLGNNFGEILGYGKNNENANKFSLVGMTVPNAAEGAEESLIAHSFRTINFIITDNADKENVIIVKFKSTTADNSGVSGSGLIDITASYNGNELKSQDDKTTLNTLWRASFRNRWHQWAGYPFNFEFSKDDAKLNFYGLPTNNSEIATLNYLEDCETTSTGTKESFEVADLVGFESYTVEMQFCDFCQAPQANNIEYKANVVLFEMAGQVLSNSTANAVDTVGPMVEQKYKQVVTQKEYDLSELLSIYDIVEGKIDTIGTTEGKYSVKVDGVESTNGKYTFTQDKNYQIEYIIYDTYDKAGSVKNSITKTITVEGVKDTLAPTLSWNKIYKDTYYTNTNLSLYDINVLDDNDLMPMVSVKAFIKDGESWKEISVSENIVNLSVAGKYKVQYTATDFSGNSATLEDTFFVNDLVLNVQDNIEEDFVSQMFYVPMISLDEELSYYIEKFDIMDINFANGERINTSAIMFDAPCSFTLRYTIFSGNESSVVATKVVNVMLKEVAAPEVNIPEMPETQTPQKASDENFFTSTPFVISLGVVLVASTAFNVILMIKRRKNV